MSKPHISLFAWQRFLKGTQLLLAADPLRAAQALREAIEIAPDFYQAHHNLALALRERGDRAGALYHAKNAGCSGAPESLVLQGALLMLFGRTQAALRCFKAAVSRRPQSAVALAHLGVAHQLMGHRAASLRALKRALKACDGSVPQALGERFAGQLSDLLQNEAGEFRLELCVVPLVSQVIAPARVRESFSSVNMSKRAAEISVEELAAWLKGAPKVVALTGAGLSAASGLLTRKALWQRFSRDDAVSIWRFREAPEHLWGVIRTFLGDEAHQPNAAHKALARLPGLGAVLTQNVDGLHQRSGDVPVIELHGTLERVLCHDCGKATVRGAQQHAQTQALSCPVCGGALRPDVVLFGERVRRFEEALWWARWCELMLVVGCAMDVAPASELPRIAARNGAQIVEFKRSRSRISDQVGSRLVLGPAEETLPKLIQLIEAPLQT